MSNSNHRPVDLPNNDFLLPNIPDETPETSSIPENRSEANTEQLPGRYSGTNRAPPQSRHQRQPFLSPNLPSSSSLFALDLQTPSTRNKTMKARPTLARLKIVPPKVYSGSAQGSSSTSFFSESPTSDLSTSGESEAKNLLSYHTECNSQLSAHLYEDTDDVNPFASQSPSTLRRHVRFDPAIPVSPLHASLFFDDKPGRVHPVPAPINTSAPAIDSEETSRSTDFAPRSTSPDLIILFPKVPTTMLNNGAGVGPWSSNNNESTTSSTRPLSSTHIFATPTLIPALYRAGSHLHHGGRGRSGVPASTSTFFPSPDITPSSTSDDPPLPRFESVSDQVPMDQETSSSSSSLSFSFPFSIGGLSRAKSTGALSFKKSDKKVQRRSVGFYPPSCTTLNPVPPPTALPPTPPTELPAFLPSAHPALSPVPTSVSSPTFDQPGSSRPLPRYMSDEDVENIFSDFDEDREVPDTPGERRRKMSAGSLLAEALDADQTPAFFGLGKSPLYPEQQSPALGALRTVPQLSSPTLHEIPHASSSRPRPLSARVYHAPFTFPSEDPPFSPLKSRTMEPPSPIARPSCTERSVSSSSRSGHLPSPRLRSTQVSSSHLERPLSPSVSGSSPSPRLLPTEVSTSTSMPRSSRSPRLRPQASTSHSKDHARHIPERPSTPTPSATLPRPVRSSSSSTKRRSEPSLAPLRLSTPVTRSSSSVSYMRNRRTFPRIPPLPSPGKSPLSLFSTSPNSNQSLIEPQSPPRSPTQLSFFPSLSRPRSPTRPSLLPSLSRPRSILDRGRPRSYQPTGTSPPLRPAPVIGQPRRTASLRRERSARSKRSAREEEEETNQEVLSLSPVTRHALLQTLSSSSTPRSQTFDTSSASTMTYDAFVDSTLAFQPLEPLVSYATAVPGVRASTPPEPQIQATQVAEWSTTRQSPSRSSMSMSLTDRWRRTFSPTRNSVPNEVTRPLTARKEKGKANEDKTQEEQDNNNNNNNMPSSSLFKPSPAPTSSSSSSSALGKQIAKLGQFFVGKGKGKLDKNKEKGEEKSEGKNKEDKEKDKDKKRKKEQQRLVSTPAAFSFQPAAEHHIHDSQEGDEDERREAQPKPSGTATEDSQAGPDDKVEMLLQDKEPDHIDTPIARRFL